MATATISKSTDDYTVNGGTLADPITLYDFRIAANSDMLVINENAITTASTKAYKYKFDAASFVDFSNSRVFLRNIANGENIHFTFEGNITIGSATDYTADCELHFGDLDSGGYANVDFPLFGTSASTVIDCPNIRNRIKIMSHLNGPASSNAAEPGSRNGVWLYNNVVGNKIRVSILGSSYSLGSSYTLPSPTGFKPNGTMIANWQIGPNVSVRDIEFRDGYVDWRPSGTWEAPTRGIFVSETWIKFLGTKPSAEFDLVTPIVFGSSDTTFELTVGNSGQVGSYFLCGIYPTAAQSRLVYNNFKGLEWLTALAVYCSGNDIGVEHHKQLDMNIIDSLTNPIKAASVIIDKKDPVYTTTMISNAFSADAQLITASDVNGDLLIGNGDGSLANNICVEVFSKNGSGGNVDTAYGNADYANCTYNSNPDIYYSIYAWGQAIVYKQLYTLTLATATGGKESLGVIKMSPALGLTAINIAGVSSTAKDTHDLYENLYKYSFDNTERQLATEEGGITIIDDADIVLSSSLSIPLIAYDSSLTPPRITVNNGGGITGKISSVRKIIIKAEINLTNLDVTGDLYINTGSSSTVTFDNVKVSGDIYNDDASNTLTVSLINGSAVTTTTPGTGPGQVNIVTSTDFKVTGLIDSTEVRVYTSDLTTEIYGIENSVGDVTFSYTDTYVDAVMTLFNVGYLPQRIVLQLDGNAATLPVNQVFDRNYKNN